MCLEPSIVYKIEGDTTSDGYCSCVIVQEDLIYNGSLSEDFSDCGLDTWCSLYKGKRQKQRAENSEKNDTKKIEFCPSAN